MPEAIAAFELLARASGPESGRSALLRGEPARRTRAGGGGAGPSRLAGRRSAPGRALADGALEARLEPTTGTGDSATRSERFESLAASTADPIGRLKPIYWRARAMAGAGRGDEATAEFECSARGFPALVLRLAGAAPRFEQARRRSRTAALSAAGQSPPDSRARSRAFASWSRAGLHEYGAAETGRLVRRGGRPRRSAQPWHGSSRPPPTITPRSASSSTPTSCPSRADRFRAARSCGGWPGPTPSRSYVESATHAAGQRPPGARLRDHAGGEQLPAAGDLAGGRARAAADHAGDGGAARGARRAARRSTPTSSSIRARTSSSDRPISASSGGSFRSAYRPRSRATTPGRTWCAIGRRGATGRTMSGWKRFRTPRPRAT